jgi:hypothetical protein
MAAGALDDQHDHEEKEHGERDDPGHLHPARSPRVALGVRIRHHGDFTRHHVYIMAVCRVSATTYT